MIRHRHPTSQTIAPRQRGTTLAEILVVVAVMGLVFSAGVPRLSAGFETGRADLAAGALRGLWNAERMYWLEYRTYTSDIDALIDHKFIDQAVKNATEPYTFSITAAAEETFTIEAERIGSGNWSGTLTIDQDGLIAGEIDDGAGKTLKPYQEPILGS
jgi:type II secretory pathway pseudopilin PulG